MAGLRKRVSTTVARVAAGMIAAAFLAPVALVAPTMPHAAADPIGDADAAITAAWDAAGGPGGQLGPKDGGVYPAGAGFGQNFAGGRVYFTPATGAHVMAGAILDKYLSLGGPADGDLGFPTIDEGAGKAPNSRNTTFSAADNPVIFWTPDTGARVVRGAINAAWDKLGGSAGVLGVPSEDEVYRGDEISQVFTGGQLTWNRKTGAFTSTPPELAGQLAGLPIPGDATTAINTARRAAGGPMGPLGAAQGDQYEIGADGVGQNYAGGKIFYTPATGANVVTGQILAKYESVGGPEGDLGFPTSSEADGGLTPASSVVTFAAADKPVIFWTPDYGAVIVRGAMNAAWSKLGGATGELGAPTADQAENGDVITQKFSGGALSWNRATNEWTTEPGNLASQLSGLEVPGAGTAPQTPPQGDVSTSADDAKWYTSLPRWWLLAIVPVALLLIAVIVGVVLNRRRRRDHDDRPPLSDFDDDYDRGYDDDDEHDDHEGDDDYDDFDDLESEPRGGFASGPLPVVGRPGLDPGAEPPSMWAMPDRERHPAPEAESPFGPPPAGPFTPPGTPYTPTAAPPPDEPTTAFAVDPDHDAIDQDAIDTAPTRIESEPDGRAAEPPARDADDRYSESIVNYDDYDEDFDDEGFDDEGFDDDEDVDASARNADDLVDEEASGPPSGRHAAIHLDEPTAAQPALRLATDDGFHAPDGYPIKADTKTGLYFAPGSGGYDRVRAEIWFASEEFALTNGFAKG